MIRNLINIIMAAGIAFPLFAVENAADRGEQTTPSLPPANRILAQARANLPHALLLIKGQILSGGRLGKLERVCYLDVFFDFTGAPAIIQYRLNDAFGSPLEQMTVTVDENCEPEFEYETGNPLRPAPSPVPSARVRDTDVAWNDLCFLFLWREDGRTARKDDLRGRDCYVIEFAGPGKGITRLWIEAQLLVLLQMEEMDADGNPRRRMTVKNIKKISDQWMIKNMEIRSYPSLHHTMIRIDEVVSSPQSTANSQQSAGDGPNSPQSIVYGQ